MRFILEDKTFEEPITVNEFENICSAEFGRFSQMLTDVLSKQNVSSVMFAGGSSRLQWFKRAVEKMSNIIQILKPFIIHVVRPWITAHEFI